MTNPRPLLSRLPRPLSLVLVGFMATITTGAQRQCPSGGGQPEPSLCRSDSDCPSGQLCDVVSGSCFTPEETPIEVEPQPEDQNGLQLGYEDGNALSLDIPLDAVTYNDELMGMATHATVVVEHPELGSHTYALSVRETGFAVANPSEGDYRHVREAQTSIVLSNELGSSHIITWSTSGVSAVYQTGQFTKKGGFNTSRLPTLLDLFQTHGTLYSPETNGDNLEAISGRLEGQLPLDRPDLWWKGYPLHRVALTALFELHQQDLVEFDPSDLILTTWAHSEAMSGMDEDDTTGAWRMVEQEVAGEFQRERRPPVEINDAPQCIIPDQKNLQTGGLNINVGPVTASLSVGELKVSVMREQNASLRGKSWLSAWNAASSDGDSCAGAAWYQIGERKVSANVDAGSEAECTEAGKCCKNGGDDLASTGKFELKLGAEGIDLSLPNVDGDALGGKTSIKGDAWLCYDEDVFFDDYLDSAHSIKLVAELF